MTIISHLKFFYVKGTVLYYDYDYDYYVKLPLC
jgi:hypothetical protein